MLEVNRDLNKKFMEFYKAVFKDDALDLKTKELIAIGASLGAGCGSCFNLHASKAREAGATDEEIREAIAVSEVVSAGRVRMNVSEYQHKPQAEKQ